MTENDLQREMEWAFAKILFAAKELKYSGFFPPDGASPFRDGASDASVRDWVRNDAGAMMVVKTLASRAIGLVDSYIKGTDTCENCGQLMQRSYPLGLPLGVYVLCCAGCGTNMNYVANHDMIYAAGLYPADFLPTAIGREAMKEQAACGNVWHGNNEATDCPDCGMSRPITDSSVE